MLERDKENAVSPSQIARIDANITVAKERIKSLEDAQGGA